jgi:hypothetical protein
LKMHFLKWYESLIRLKAWSALSQAETGRRQSEAGDPPVTGLQTQRGTFSPAAFL